MRDLASTPALEYCCALREDLPQGQHTPHPLTFFSKQKTYETPRGACFYTSFFLRPATVGNTPGRPVVLLFFGPPRMSLRTSTLVRSICWVFISRDISVVLAVVAVAIVKTLSTFASVENCHHHVDPPTQSVSYKKTPYTSPRRLLLPLASVNILST